MNFRCKVPGSMKLESGWQTVLLLVQAEASRTYGRERELCFLIIQISTAAGNTGKSYFDERVTDIKCNDKNM